MNGSRPRRRRRSLVRRLLLLAGAIVAAGVVLGLVFAGSPTTIADGVRIDGVDVGGMEATSAQALLQRKAAALEHRPIVFAAAGKRFPISASTLGVAADWKGAVENAMDIELLDRTQFSYYFPESTILTERVAGMPKSLIATR